MCETADLKQAKCGIVAASYGDSVDELATVELATNDGARIES